MNDIECITCEYVIDDGYVTFFCGHPDLPKKHKKKSLIIDIRGHPNHCPIANIVFKEIEKGRKENGY